jgi:hypothetical protein
VVCVPRVGREKGAGSRDAAQGLQGEEDRWSRPEFSSRDQPRPSPARTQPHNECVLAGRMIPQFCNCLQTTALFSFQRTRIAASGPWGHGYRTSSVLRLRSRNPSLSLGYLDPTRGPEARMFVLHLQNCTLKLGSQYFAVTMLSQCCHFLLEGQQQYLVVRS